MPALQFSELVEHYRDLADTAKVTDAMAAASEAMARKILLAKQRYQEVEAATTVPWFVVGIIHAMEASCSWNSHLHNGDPLTGKTVCVPKGRPLTGKGPFTWEESAVDALEMKKLRGTTWTLERALYELERYNGQGYLLHHPETPSPYLWSGTTAYSKGKYVEDGKWSATAVSKQVGAYPLLVYLSHADESAVLPREEVAHVEETTAESFRKAVPEAEAEPATKPLIKSGTAISTGTASGAGAYATVGMTKKAVLAAKTDAGVDWLSLASNTIFDEVWLSVFVGSVLAGYAVYRRYQKDDIDGLLKSSGAQS